MKKSITEHASAIMFAILLLAAMAMVSALWHPVSGGLLLVALIFSAIWLMLVSDQDFTEAHQRMEAKEPVLMTMDPDIGFMFDAQAPLKHPDGLTNADLANIYLYRAPRPGAIIVLPKGQPGKMVL